MTTRSHWRHNLDPRDPDYMDPPTDEEVEEAEDTAIFYAEGRSYED